MLTNQQIDQFEQIGAVTIDTPLTDEELQAARDAYDGLFPGPQEHPERRNSRYARTADFFDQAILDLIQHSFFEEVAASALRTKEIRFNNIGISKTYPRPDADFEFDQHTDVQYSLSDLDATPRRMVCSFFLWLDDVNDKRAPLMYRPRSHRQIAAWRAQNPGMEDEKPRVNGISFENLPPLDFEPPEPIVANAGQATVLTTALIHGPSSNVDTRPRYACHLSYRPRGFSLILQGKKQEAQQAYHQALKRRLRPERLHLVSD